MTAFAGTSPVQRRNERPSMAWLSAAASPGPEALAFGSSSSTLSATGSAPTGSSMVCRPAGR